MASCESPRAIQLAQSLIRDLLLRTTVRTVPLHFGSPRKILFLHLSVEDPWQWINGQVLPSKRRNRDAINPRETAYSVNEFSVFGRSQPRLEAAAAPPRRFQ